MIKIQNNFESGAIDVVDANNAQDIQLNITKDNDACTRQWFYFSVLTETAQHQRIRILNAGKVSFPLAWHDYQVFASYDNEQWFRVNTCYDSEQLIIEHDAKSKVVYYAYFVPYSLNRQKVLLQEVKQHPLVDIQTLTQTALGHNLDLIIVGEFALNKKHIWLIARQHPGESMAQWISEGFLKAVCSDQASNLLDKYTFFIVTNMNPDGSQLGNHRTNYHGKNLNRCWDEPSLELCPEVSSVRDAMYQYGVDLFFDVHGDESIPHNFIMSKSSDLVGEQFKKVLAKIDSNFQLQYDYDSYNTSCGTSCCNSGCGKSKTSTGFVAEEFGVTSLLLEASFKNLQSANVADEWDDKGCLALGKSLLVALTHVLDVEENKQAL